MVNNEIIQFLLSVIAGTLVGILYFGGLYYTLHRVTSGKGGALFTVFSFIVRLAVLGAALVGIALAWGWPQLLAAGASAILVRVVMARRIKAGLNGETGEIETEGEHNG